MGSNTPALRPARVEAAVREGVEGEGIEAVARRGSRRGARARVAPGRRARRARPRGRTCRRRSARSARESLAQRQRRRRAGPRGPRRAVSRRVQVQAVGEPHRRAGCRVLAAHRVGAASSRRLERDALVDQEHRDAVAHGVDDLPVLAHEAGLERLPDGLAAAVLARRRRCCSLTAASRSAVASASGWWVSGQARILSRSWSITAARRFLVLGSWGPSLWPRARCLRF